MLLHNRLPMGHHTNMPSSAFSLDVDFDSVLNCYDVGVEITYRVHVEL